MICFLLPSKKGLAVAKCPNILQGLDLDQAIRDL